MQPEVTINDRPVNSREDPDVLQGWAIGAVVCDSCGGVHVDIVDASKKIVATGFLNFDQWLLMTGGIARDIEKRLGPRH